MKGFGKKFFSTRNIGGQCARQRNCNRTGRPLSEQECSGKFKVCKINGDRKHCAKLASLGVLPGKEMELICPHTGSQCIVKIHGGNLTLDKETSEQILVENE